MSECQELAEFFDSLSPDARAAALVYGVVDPHVCTAPQIARILEHALDHGDIESRGRRLSTARLREANREVVEKRLVFAPRRGAGLRASPHWAPWLTLEAHRCGLLDRIVAGHEHVHPRHPYYHDEARAAMELRCHTVAGRFSHVRGDRIGPEGWRFLAEPGAAGLLRTLPEAWRDRALSGCLMHVIRTAAPPEAIVEACRDLGSDPPAFAADIAFIRILQGRLDEVDAVFDALPPELREDKRARTGHAGARALVATLRGDDGEARRHIEAAVAEERAGTRKRNVFPASPGFALSLLSLVRDDSPSSRTLLTQLLRTAEQGNDEPLVVHYVARACDMRKGARVAAMMFPAPELGTLLQGLECCWLGQFGQYAEPAPCHALVGYANRVRDHGFSWALAECLSVIGQPDLPMMEGRPLPATAYREEADALHARLDTRSLTSLLAPMEEWEYPLKALEELAFETRSKPAASKKSGPSTRRRRLAWELCEDLGEVVAKPREQHQYKNGTWSAGRPVSMKRLATSAANMDFLLEQDRAAAARIRQTRDWNGRQHYYLGSSGLSELAGHPHLFSEAGAPMEVVRGEPELVVDEHEGGLRARLVPDYADSEGYHVQVLDNRRCEVTRFTRGHKRLRAIIPEGGLELPAATRARLLDAVSALASEVRIHGGIAGGAGAARPVEADPRTRVRLEPSGAGLVAELVVEPIPGSGTWFEPGAGGATVFASRDGETVQAQRDLPAERAGAEGLAAACPALAAAAGAPPPWVFPDPSGALELLEQLRAAEAPCLWPKGEPFRIVARAEASSLSLTIKSAAEWFNASGTLAVDEGRGLDLKELFTLLDASPDSRFLEIGDGEFIALTSSFRRQLDDLRSLSAPAARGSVRVHGMAAIALGDFAERTTLDADAGWRVQQERLRDAGAFEPELPSTLQAELRPYQRDGFRWLARLARGGAGACLADDMGLGKTVQTLALLLDRAPGGPALVVAPTSVVANWLDEARRFAPTLNTVAYTGATSSRARLIDKVGPFDVIVTTYGLLQNDADSLSAIDWHSAVLDEAQAIKNPATKRARAARGLKAGFRLVTTGTPIQNNLMDLYSLLGFTNPGMLGSTEHYRRHFASPIERDGEPAARARLRRLIAPFVLRRLKTDVLDDLPPRTEVILHVEMSPAEAALYEALRRRAVEDLETRIAEGPGAGEGRLEILAHLTRLRLACCNPRLVQDAGAPESSKLATFAETLDELLASRHKVLVFSQFVMHLKLIEEHLDGSGIAYQYLDGSTPAKARAERIAAFQAGRGEVFLISLKAGGVGLNLTAADYVIHMDPWWNPAAEDQASDRAHRIGQTRPVTIYRLVTKGTIEEQVVALHHHKRDLAERLLEGADAPARLDAGELLELLRQPLA
ncbi:MAG: DEAD/DEAH box helicase [Immundisolibacterales bacterium]|nr:DEAD/DEAH box helicase [Immundisolibacterales bacterium]